MAAPGAGRACCTARTQLRSGPSLASGKVDGGKHGSSRSSKPWDALVCARAVGGEVEVEGAGGRPRTRTGRAGSCWQDSRRKGRPWKALVLRRCAATAARYIPRRAWYR